MKHHKHHRPQQSANAASGGQWLYGQHAVEAALKNQNRRCNRLLLLPDNADNPVIAPLCAERKIRPEIVDKKTFDSLFGHGAVHQGFALSVEKLPDLGIEDIVRQYKSAANVTVLILDQVTDPHNIGAILRSAAAFGAAAVVVQDKNSPEITPVLAKAASGAVDVVPLVRVVNIARAMDYLKQNEYWCIGLDGSTDKTLAQVKSPGKNALVLGAEGEGMRRLVIENCDFIAKLPISSAMESLNVSNAAAIALYELARDRNDGP